FSSGLVGVRKLSMLYVWFFTVGEPINHEAWHWFHSVVGEGRCPLVDTWWQTETGGVCIAPHPADHGAPIIPAMAMRPFFGIQPVLMGEKVRSYMQQYQESSVFVQPVFVLMDLKVGSPDTLEEHPGCELTVSSAGHYFTGDGAFRSEDGYYQITGRIDDVINVSGHRLGTAEIEDALVKLDAFQESSPSLV
ncbi:hypothetical protein GOODEAATRI_029830, partial [Goodea atripinnis]